MRNERGFIMPLVVILSFLFIAVVVHQIELLESERRFFQERKNYFLHDSLFQLASTEIISILEKSDTIELTNGQFNFESGTIIYKVTDNTGTTARIQLTSTTDLPGKREIFFSYDTSINGIAYWTE